MTNDINAFPRGPAGRLIEHYKMELIPQEGAWFALMWVSGDRIAEGGLPARYAGTGGRVAGNAIVALVTRRDFSAMHRLITPETWHFYGGDAAELVLLHADGRGEVVVLGADFAAGEQVQVTVPAGTWMGARPARDGEEAYSFFGCTLAPGFDYGDYEHGYREELQAGWPGMAGLIAGLTREDSVRRPGGATEAPLGKRRSLDDEQAWASRVVGAGEAAELAVGAGVRVRELVGRRAVARTDGVSVARFCLEAGATTGASRYHGADEFFVILSGRGVAVLNGAEAAVGAGDVVAIRRGDPHALRADGGGALEFLAVIAPGFNPSHYAPERAGA